MGGTISPERSRRLFHMASQCLERAESMFIKAEEEGRELTVAGANPREARKPSSSVGAERPRKSRLQDNSQLTRSAQHLTTGSQTLPAGSHTSPARTTSGSRPHSGASVPKSSGSLTTRSVQ